MTLKLRYISIGLCMAAIFVTAFALFYVAKANPSFFLRANSTACGSLTATTTRAFMSQGAATTTYTYDTGCAAAGSVDRAVFLAQFTGSSTVSAVQIAFEYSQDNQDWYGDRVFTSASTTQSFSINQPNTYLWGFSSSSVSGGVIGSTTVNNRAIDVPTPTRYVRAVVTVPAGALNGAFWAEFVGKRQSY